MSDASVRVDPAAFGRIVGCPVELARQTLAPLRLPELRYQRLDAGQLAAILAGFEETIRIKQLRTVGSDDPTVWEKGWGELAAALRGQDITFESLRPQYFHADVPCRLLGELIQPATPDFEYWVGLGVRQLVFAEFLGQSKRVVEFGCGTGLNLLLLALHGEADSLIGCDWATASQEILTQMARQTGQPIAGKKFNMLSAEGWDGAAIDAETTVLTVHALEQLGGNWRPFLDYVLARRPGLCVHLEPLVELYDPQKHLDDLARRYHLKRNYLQGYLPAVEALAAAGKAKIVARRRTAFGGLYHEAYSVLVWRPL